MALDTGKSQSRWAIVASIAFLLVAVSTMPHYLGKARTLVNEEGRSNHLELGEARNVSFDGLPDQETKQEMKVSRAFWVFGYDVIGFKGEREVRLALANNLGKAGLSAEIAKHRTSHEIEVLILDDEIASKAKQLIRECIAKRASLDMRTLADSRDYILTGQLGDAEIELRDSDVVGRFVPRNESVVDLILKLKSLVKGELK